MTTEGFVISAKRYLTTYRWPLVNGLLLPIMVVLSLPFARADVQVDPAFGFIETNIAIKDNLEDQGGHSVLLQGDGKYVVAGYADVGPGTNTEAHFLLMRFMDNGERDGSFGDSGAVVTVIDPGKGAPYQESANKVIQQTDNKLVAVGGTYGTDSHFALVRYLSLAKS